jgi:hypothetical protein
MKQECAMNKMLLPQNQGLIAQQDAECQEKADTQLVNLFFWDRVRVRFWAESFLAAAVEQIVALGVKLGDQDSAADSIAALKNELANEKQAQEKPRWMSRPFPGQLRS